MTVGIVAFVTHPLPELRTALRGIRETAPPDAQLAVVATGLGDQDATYLLRQYLRGRIHALDFERAGGRGSHCGLGRAYQLVRGDYIVRVDDTLEFQPGWLERAISALEADPSLGCLSLVPPADYHRGRGRPRTVHVEPIAVDRLDMTRFIAPRGLVERHECELMGEQADGCRFQEYLRAENRRLAFLPGLVSPLGLVEDASGFDSCSVEAELPAHEGVPRHAAPAAGLRPRRRYPAHLPVVRRIGARGPCGAHPLLRAAPGRHRLLVRAALSRVRRAPLQGRLPVPLP